MYNNSLENDNFLKPIVPPDSCPSCGGEVSWVNDQIFCTSNSCPAKTLKKIEHFAKTMKIKGLGEKTIEKIDMLKDIQDIYSLSPEVLFPAIGEKLGEKLLQEIEKSKSVDVGTFITAFSIPLFGNTASNALSKLDFEFIEEITYKDLRSIGIGDKAATNFIKWLQDDWINKYCYLPITITKSSKTPTSLGTVVITGTFDEPRSVLANKLSNLGFDVKDSISSKTKYLLAKDSNSTSSKVKKAQEKNIIIVNSIEELLRQAKLE